MKIKNFLIGIIILLMSAIVIIAYFTIWPWIMISLGISILPNPPKPEITYNEFPVCLVYEINGERKVIKDTLICEYDGIRMDEGRGKYRKWKQHLSSGNKEIFLLKVNDTKKIYYNPGPADYYMDDMSEGERYHHNFPDASYFEKYADGSTSDGIICANELYEKYKIKLISWDYTKPITNKFSKGKR